MAAPWRIISRRKVGGIKKKKKDTIAGKLRKLSKESFTGRIMVVTANRKGEEEEYCILVEKGDIIRIASKDGKEVSLGSIIEIMATRDNGFIELEALTLEQLEALKQVMGQASEAIAPLAQLVDALEARLQVAPSGEEESKTGSQVEEEREEVEKAARIVEYDRRKIEEISEKYSRHFDKILMILRENSRTIERSRKVGLGEVLERAIASIKPDEYLGLHARGEDREALVLLRGRRVCYAVGRDKNGYHVLNEDNAPLFFGEDVEYVLFPVDASFIDEIIPECRAERGKTVRNAERREHGTAGLGALLGLLGLKRRRRARK